MNGARYQRHTWQAGQLQFQIVLGRSTYSVALHGPDGKRLAWSGRNWGPSLTGALAMACYTGESDRAASALRFLFARIDGYLDWPGVCDLWRAARYIGETEKARHLRFQPYRDAMAAAKALRFSGGWSQAMADAARIKSELERELV